MPAPPATAALILAAGSSTRFGANKLLADFRGRPILQHVLDVVAAADLSPVVIVVGPDHAALDVALAWHDGMLVVNDRPERGISSSLQAGLAAVARTDTPRVLVFLGDQPLLAVEQVRPLIAIALDPARPIVVPRFGGRPGNPVLLDRPAWPLAQPLSGDRGMVHVIEARPELVRYVDIPGTNPDVDTPGDLAALG